MDTSFAVAGGKGGEEALFNAAVNDYGLYDAGELGLVSTPRVAIRDDTVPEAKTYRSRLYHVNNDPCSRTEGRSEPWRCTDPCPIWA